MIAREISRTGPAIKNVTSFVMIYDFILNVKDQSGARDPKQRKIEITIKSRSRLKITINNQHTTTNQNKE